MSTLLEVKQFMKRQRSKKPVRRSLIEDINESWVLALRALTNLNESEISEVLTTVQDAITNNI